MRLKPLGVLVIFVIAASVLVPLVIGGLEDSGAIRMRRTTELSAIDVMLWILLALIAVMALTRPSPPNRD